MQPVVDAYAIIEATAGREGHVFGGRMDRGHLGLVQRAIATAVRVADRDDCDRGGPMTATRHNDVPPNRHVPLRYQAWLSVLLAA